MIASKVFPVYVRFGLQEQGRTDVLDAVVDYLPSPLDVPPVVGIDPSDPSMKSDARGEGRCPFSALGFKLINDPFGKLWLYSRLLRRSEDRRNGFEPAHRQDGARRPPGEDAREQARRYTEIYAGDICASVGLKDIEDGRYVVRSERSSGAERD